MDKKRVQAVTGVTAPETGEAIIRQVWPSVARFPPVAGLGRILTRSIIGAPVAWLMMAPFYFVKILPGVATRYTLTNRRLMIQRGLMPKATKELELAAIQGVRVKRDGNSDFYRAGDLEILSQNQVVLILPGVPEPESFRHAIVNAYRSWTPRKGEMPFVPAKATS
jgi:hypothetical protein